MSSRSIFFAVALSTLLACPAEAQPAHDPLTTTFSLRTVTGRNEQRIVLTTATSGLIPILTPGWSCAWSRTPRQLVVECFPRNEDQGVTIRVGCSDQSPSGDVSAIHLSTDVDAGTDVVASCYSK